MTVFTHSADTTEGPTQQGLDRSKYMTDITGLYAQLIVRSEVWQSFVMKQNWANIQMLMG